MEHFKQSKSTRKLNTQPSMPMLGAGGKQLSQHSAVGANAGPCHQLREERSTASDAVKRCTSKQLDNVQ
ncbi:hypothetical protein GN244_ATG00734 [Phytophthora infestans]|uniref:Uncharacterized protein n=1 Tax=Phytophthora infestans TaxID=4787 RepID=A0A833TBY0_PHYIN|nr:hypothetical protein GN244_ATG00734 [Phytophthora infestans]